AELLRAQGYIVQKRTLATGPQADLLLSRGKECIACWLYQGERRVRLEAVARAAAMSQVSRGWRTMVLSSQWFTPAAQYRARREGCVMIDREALASMVVQYRRGHRVIAFSREEVTGLRGRK